MRTVKGLGALAIAALTGWSFLEARVGSWAFVAVEFAFIAWFSRELRRVDGAALLARASPPLEPDEIELVRRYLAYFARPAFTRECASTLSAIGLSSLVLVPWLIYKLQWAQAILIGMMLFAVGRLTKLASPVYALRLAGAKGDREALRLLSAHDGAARKLSAPDQPESGGERDR
jgi:biotin transporter BioY